MKPALLCVALLAFAASAQAGSQTAPEITDPAGDPAPMGGGSLPVCNGPCSFADLRSGWVVETELELMLYIDGPNNPNAYGAAEYEFHFTVNGRDYMAGLSADAANTFFGIPGSGAVRATGVATSAKWLAGGVQPMELIVPRDAIGDPVAGDVLSKAYLTSETDAYGAVSGFWTDRAPNSGYGQTYTFTMGGGEEPEPEPEPITYDFAYHDVEGSMSGSDSYTDHYAVLQYNWTNPEANATLTWGADVAAGSVQVEVFDAGSKASLFLSNLTADEPAAAWDLAGTVGVWTVVLDLNGFSGNLTLLLDPLAGEAPETPTPKDPEVPSTQSGNNTGTQSNGQVGNETSDDTKESPAAPAFIAVLAAVMALRRRL